MKTHKEMLDTYLLSPPNYFGDQGFLNWFFQNRTTNVISARYNTVLRQKVTIEWISWLTWIGIRRMANAKEECQSVSFRTSYGTLEFLY